MTTGIDDAVELMERVLARLVAGGATDAADHLRGSIEKVRATPPMQFEQELNEARAALNAERLRRQGRPPDENLH